MAQSGLPETRVAKPWTLVRHGSELRLAFVTKYFGGGWPIGDFNGGKGHLVLDSGMFTDESDEQVVFRAGDFIYEWQNRPTFAQLEAARAREAA
jgi:hypothetical protein